MISPSLLRISPLATKAARHSTAISLLALALTAAASAQETGTFFRQNCASCHSIGGGRLVGPDLKNVDQRQDAEWLVRFIANPKSVLDSGDPYALKLKEEARGALMPPIVGMTAERARALLDLIRAESKLEQSQFAGLQIGDEPFSAADIERGRRLFVGEQRLANGGAACLSCHTVRGVAALGGGRLGPDLSKVFERLQGRKNLATWLQAPATQTMRPVFLNNALTNEEIVPLVAYLENSARQGGEDNRASQPAFLLLGLGGAVCGLVVADVAWRGRLRGVRRPLVRGGK